MNLDKNSCYQIIGIINALCILISGIYGFVDISIDRNNYLTNVIVNLSCIIFSFLFLYNELNSVPNLEVYINKFILFLFSGLLVLGTSEVGFGLGFVIITYSLINISLYYINYKKPIEENNSNPYNNNNEIINSQPSYTNSFDREDSPPNPYKMNVPLNYNGQTSDSNNYDINTINRNSHMIQYGSSV